MKRRIGNDIKGLKWTVNRRVEIDGVQTVLSEDFSECSEIKIVCFNTKIRTEKIIPEYGIQNGVILINIPAEEIKELGPYSIILEYKKPDSALAEGIGTHALDWKDAFIIVGSSEQEDCQGQGYLSIIEYAKDGKSAYEYWLDFHEGTIEDFVNWMQRPAVIAALRVEAFINESQVTIDQLSERISDVEADINELVGEPDDIQQYPSYFEFPSIGKDNVLYIDISANQSYRWDPVNYKYFKLNEFDIINGGE